MQAVAANLASVTSGATQDPLLNTEQLTPGCIIVGIASTHAWQIEEMGDEIVLQRLPVPCIPTHHTHQYKLHGKQQRPLCICGKLRTPLASLMPKPGSATRARFHILTPNGLLLQPAQNNVIYGGVARDGTVVHLSIKTQNAPNMWTINNVPIIPVLHKIWEMPVELQVLVQGSSGLEPLEVEE